VSKAKYKQFAPIPVVKVDGEYVPLGRELLPHEDIFDFVVLMKHAKQLRKDVSDNNKKRGLNKIKVMALWHETRKSVASDHAADKEVTRILNEKFTKQKKAAIALMTITKLRKAVDEQIRLENEPF
jgi:uncharacterized protein YeeX (DUF496 family)